MAALARFGLEDKIVIVTGAGRGIGRTIAMECFQSGAKIAVGSRTTTELEALASEIEAEGGECFYHSLDVTNVESIQAFMDAVIGHYGRIDVLVNNAGYNKVGKILDYDEELYDLIVDANLKNVFFCSQIAARQMIAQGGGGNIVNISSQAGVVGAPERGPYSGAKGGVTRSPLAETARRESEAFANAVKEKNLLRGALAEPEEMSAPVIFLASDAAAMITGHTLVVDGGWTIV